MEINREYSMRSDLSASSSLTLNSSDKWDDANSSLGLEQKGKVSMDEKSWKIKLRGDDKELIPALAFSSIKQDLMFPEEIKEARERYLRLKKRKHTRKAKDRGYKETVRFAHLAKFFVYDRDIPLPHTHFDYSQKDSELRFVQHCEINLVTGHALEYFLEDFENLSPKIYSNENRAREYWRTIMMKGYPIIKTREDAECQLNSIYLHGGNFEYVVPLWKGIKESELLDPGKEDIINPAAASRVMGLSKPRREPSGVRGDGKNAGLANVYKSWNLWQAKFPDITAMKLKQDMNGLKEYVSDFVADWKMSFDEAKVLQMETADKQRLNDMFLAMGDTAVLPATTKLLADQLFLNIYARNNTIRKMCKKWFSEKLVSKFRKVYASPLFHPQYEADKAVMEFVKDQLSRLFQVSMSVCEDIEAIENHIHQRHEAQTLFRFGLSDGQMLDIRGKVVIKVGSKSNYFFVDLFSGFRFQRNEDDANYPIYYIAEPLPAKAKARYPEGAVLLTEQAGPNPRIRVNLPKPILVLNAEYRGLQEFFRRPLSGWAFTKQRWMEYFMNLLNSGVITAMMNNSAFLLNYMETFPIPRCIMESSLLSAEYDFKGKDKLGKVVKSTAGQIKISRRGGPSMLSSYHLYSTYLNPEMHRRDRGAMRVHVHCASVVLNPVVRADLYFSRRRHMCDERCTGHRNMLLSTLIRLGNEAMVKYAVEFGGLKTNVKSCVGDTMQLSWDFTPEHRKLWEKMNKARPAAEKMGGRPKKAGFIGRVKSFKSLKVMQSKFEGTLRRTGTKTPKKDETEVVDDTELGKLTKSSSSSFNGSSISVKSPKKLVRQSIKMRSSTALLAAASDLPEEVSNKTVSSVALKAPTIQTNSDADIFADEVDIHKKGGKSLDPELRKQKQEDAQTLKRKQQGQQKYQTYSQSIRQIKMDAEDRTVEKFKAENIEKDFTCMTRDERVALNNRCEQLTPLAIAAQCAFLDPNAHSVQTIKDDGLAKEMVLEKSRRVKIVTYLIEKGANILGSDMAVLRSSLPLVESLASVAKLQANRARQPSSKSLPVAKVVDSERKSLKVAKLVLSKFNLRSSEDTELDQSAEQKLHAQTSTPRILFGMPKLQKALQEEYFNKCKKSSSEKSKRFHSAWTNMTLYKDVLEQIVDALTEKHKRHIYSFKGHFCSLAIKIRMIHEALLAGKWEVVRYLAPYTVNDSKSAELRLKLKTGDPDNYDFAWKDFDKFTAEILKAVVELLMMQIKNPFVATSARHYNALYFILREYNVGLRRDEMLEFFETLLVSLECVFMSKAGERKAIMRLLNLLSFRNFLNKDQYLQEDRILTKLTFKKVKGKKVHGRDLDDAKERLCMRTLAEGVDEFADQHIYSILDSMTNRNERVLFLSRILNDTLFNRKMISMLPKILKYYEYAGINDKDVRFGATLTESVKPVLHMCMHESASYWKTTNEDSDAALALFKAGFRPDLDQAVKYIARLLSQPGIEVEDSYDPDMDLAYDLSRIFLFQRLLVYLFGDYLPRKGSLEDMGKVLADCVSELEPLIDGGIAWLQGIILLVDIAKLENGVLHDYIDNHLRPLRELCFSVRHRTSYHIELFEEYDRVVMLHGNKNQTGYSRYSGTSFSDAEERVLFPWQMDEMEKS